MEQKNTQELLELIESKSYEKIQKKIRYMVENEITLFYEFEKGVCAVDIMKDIILKSILSSHFPIKIIDKKEEIGDKLDTYVYYDIIKLSTQMDVFNYEDIHGYTFFHCVKKVSDAEFLLSKKPELINQKTKKTQMTALSVCMLYPHKNYSLIEFLIKCGSDVNIKSWFTGVSILFTTNLSLGCLKLFVENGYDIYSVNNSNENLLFKVKNLEEAMYLVEKGFEINHVNDKGQTPIDKCDNSKIKQYLIDNKDKVLSMSKSANKR